MVSLTTKHTTHAASSTSANFLKMLPQTIVSGLYLHIPFCFHKCHYCDFYSITRQTPDRMARFVDLMLAEASQWRDRPTTVQPTTVFFGGGTPSLLPLVEMQRLLRGLKERLDLSNVNEWTIEANPATLGLDYACMLFEEGVGRLSFGAQSFRPDELAILERHHEPSDVGRSVDLARRAGFKRLNIDLIYAIPGQSLEAWSENLETAIALGTEHISCYGLTYESNTPMAVKKRLGRLIAVEDDLELQMLHHTRRRLAAAGYSAYEISNYARTGEECRHNLMYWNGGGYIGLGPSAASHVEGRRWKNRGHLGEWETAVSAGTPPIVEFEELLPRQRAGELAMLQLRLAGGVQFNDFTGHTGYDARSLYDDLLARLEQSNLIVLDGTGFRLTEKGIDVADAVAAELL